MGSTMEFVVSGSGCVMRRIWIAAALLLIGTGLTATPAVAGVAPVALPEAPVGLTSAAVLPAGVDPVSPYLPQVSCNPVDMIGPHKLRDLLLATYGVGRGGISRGCTEGLSEHSEGRALDWMVDTKKPVELAAAADFLAWVTRDDGLNARRLGIMYVIYNKKIWSIYNARAGWRKSSGHTDHIHISFSWAGARGNTSFWTGAAGPIDYGPCARFKGSPAEWSNTPRARPCAKPATSLVKTSRGNRQFGRTGSTVEHAQSLLTVPVTGRFDSATWTAVRSYQRAHDLPLTGVLDQPTWASLDRGSVTKRVVNGYTRHKAAQYGVEKYSRTTLAKGRSAKAVVILQTALGFRVADRNGYFGPVTRAAVQQMQSRAGLAPDGIVKAAEWKAIRAQIR